MWNKELKRVLLTRFTLQMSTYTFHRKEHVHILTIPQSEKEKRKGIKLPPFFLLLWENSVIYKVDRLFIKVLAVSSSKNSKVIKKNEKVKEIVKLEKMMGLGKKQQSKKKVCTCVLESYDTIDYFMGMDCPCL